MNAETREIERLRDAFASLSETARPTDACPQAERLWAAARSEAPPDETRDVIDHTASCAACAESWRLAVRLSEEAPQAEVHPRRPRATVVTGWWRAAVAAALVLGVVGVWRLAGPASAPASDVVRDGGGSGLVSEISETEPLPRASFVLRWHLEPAPEGTLYSVRVTTDDLLTAIAEARRLETPSFQVSEADLAGLASGATLFWRVEAFRADGTKLDSKSFGARVE